MMPTSPTGKKIKIGTAPILPILVPKIGDRLRLFIILVCSFGFIAITSLTQAEEGAIQEVKPVTPAKTVKKVLCPSCGGYGRIGTAEKAETCPVCKGSGYGVITKAGPGVEICSQPPQGCGGMGQILLKEKFTWPDGKEDVRYKNKKCQLCDGKGYRTKPIIE